MRPKGFANAGLDQLEAVLKTAKRRRSQRALTWDGGRRMAVTYAIFDFGPGPGAISTAEHEAAHVIVAWRLGIPIRGVALMPSGGQRGVTVCDWEFLYGTRSGRDTCIAGFAVAYAGMARDVYREEELSFEDLLTQLPTDAQAIEDVCVKLRSWEQLDASNQSTVEADGRQLAQKLVLEECERIERLGDHLIFAQSMDEGEITAWLDADQQTKPEESSLASSPPTSKGNE